MKDQFDWQIGDPETGEESLPVSIHSRRLVSSFLFLLAAAIITGLLIGGWRVGQAQLDESEQRLRTRIQMLLDLETSAFEVGDGELFFSVQTDEPAWLSAQLQPQNQALYAADPQVTRVQSHGDTLWANISWNSGAETWQRIAFFAWQDDRLRHITTDPSYWGNRLQIRTAWGELAYHQVDDPWSITVDMFVESIVTAICESGCVPGWRPIRLELASDYSDTAQPNHISMPSPRLWALTEDGRPAPPFWQELQNRLENYLKPATIRFAVPSSGTWNELALIDYERAAAIFREQHPEIHLELVTLEEVPADPAELALEFDGAAVPPTAAMLAAGLVRDLTDYVNTDPDFDQADFYEQIWQGTIWQDRIWFVPQAALMNLLFYDKQAYQVVGIPEPTLRWTWDEMTHDIPELLTAGAEAPDLNWGFMDIGLDSLYSYAYNWDNRCPETPTVFCRSVLRPQNVAAALTWYKQTAGQADQVPDLSTMTADERQFFLWNTQTAHRRVAVWVDRPNNYETQLLLKSLGVVPFPGSDRFDGITPLWIRGSFISQASQQPLAVWEWLKFLSYQRPMPRLVPARPSVAQQMGYWTLLPPSLGNAMRTAFPFARPVTLSEHQVFSWSQVGEVLSGDLTPDQAAQQAPDLEWFQQPN